MTMRNTSLCRCLTAFLCASLVASALDLRVHTRASAANCGTWTSDLGYDPDVSVTIEQDLSGNCEGIFRLSNTTGTAGLLRLGYTMAVDIVTRDGNSAGARWDPDPRTLVSTIPLGRAYLIPGVEGLRLRVPLQSTGSSARVSISAAMTDDSIATDARLALLTLLPNCVTNRSKFAVSAQGGPLSQVVHRIRTNLSAMAELPSAIIAEVSSLAVTEINCLVGRVGTEFQQLTNMLAAILTDLVYRSGNVRGPALFAVTYSPVGGGIAPTAPSNLRATPTDPTHVRLDWNDNSNNEAGFAIYDGNIFLTNVGANTTTYLVGGLGSSSYHCYHLYAFNAAGDSAWTDWGCATTPGGVSTPPPAPSNLRATPTDSTHVRLDWNDNSNNEAGFAIYDGNIFLTNVGANTTTYLVGGLGPSSYHCYHLYAFNAAGDSAWTDWGCAMTPGGASVLPPAPSNLRASAMDSSLIRLDWNDNSNNEEGFAIYDGGIRVTNVGPNTTSYIASGLLPSSYHCYHLYAFNSAGDSAWTDWGCATTLAGSGHTPAAPSNVHAEFTCSVFCFGSSSIRFSWMDNSDNEDGFRIYLCKQPCQLNTSPGSSHLATTAPANSTQATVSGVELTGYCGAVVAFNAYGSTQGTVRPGEATCPGTGTASSASAGSPGSLVKAPPTPPATASSTAPSVSGPPTAMMTPTPSRPFSSSAGVISATPTPSDASQVSRTDTTNTMPVGPTPTATGGF